MSDSAPALGRTIIIDGAHATEVLNVLRKDLGKDGTEAAIKKASKIIELSVDPIAGNPPEPSDGLLYGLIQSGKTSILTVSAAMAADNGFDCLLVLTTDNDPLYEQTLDRVRAALGGITVLGKKDWKGSNCSGGSQNLRICFGGGSPNCRGGYFEFRGTHCSGDGF